MIAGIFQLNTSYDKLNENLALIKHTISNSNADIYILPELFNTGYELKRIRERASNAKNILSELRNYAKAFNKTIIAGSIAEIMNNELKNTTYIYGPKGEEKTSYSKIHLFTLTNEGKYFKGGSNLGVWQYNTISIGCAICYDLRFPELFIKYRDMGCSVIILPAAWPLARIEHWTALGKARAIENQCFILGINRIGEDNGILFGGHSYVYSPWGKEMLLLGRESSYQEVNIDTKEIDSARKTLNSFIDRVPHLYK